MKMASKHHAGAANSSFTNDQICQAGNWIRQGDKRAAKPLAEGSKSSGAVFDISLEQTEEIVEGG